MTKPFVIPKHLVWEAFQRVKANGGSAIASGGETGPLSAATRHLAMGLSLSDGNVLTF